MLISVSINSKAHRDFKVTCISVIIVVIIIFGVEQRIDWIRTNDLQINVPALYQLSYLALNWQCAYNFIYTLSVLRSRLWTT